MNNLKKYPFHQKAISLRGGRVVYCCFIEERRGCGDIARYWRVIDHDSGEETFPDKDAFVRDYVLESEPHLPAKVRALLDAAPSWWAWRGEMMDRAAGLVADLPTSRVVA